MLQGFPCRGNTRGQQLRLQKVEKEMIEKVLIEALEIVTDSVVYAVEAGRDAYVMAIDYKNVAQLVLNAAEEAEGLGSLQDSFMSLLMQMQVDKDGDTVTCWWPCAHETWIELPMKENA